MGDVTKNFVDQILSESVFDRFGVSVQKGQEKEVVNESTEVEDEVEVNEETEEHVCPLCESVLEEALSESQIDQHLLDVVELLEATDMEAISEEFEDEEDEYEDEE